MQNYNAPAVIRIVDNLDQDLRDWSIQKSEDPIGWTATYQCTQGRRSIWAQSLIGLIEGIQEAKDGWTHEKTKTSCEDPPFVGT